MLSYLASHLKPSAAGGGSSQGHLMRAWGVCAVNSLSGLIPPVRPNDQTLADLEDSRPFNESVEDTSVQGKWDTVGTHCYSREDQMRGCFMVWTSDHVQSGREKLIYIWQAAVECLQ